jgi:YceI-like domain
MRRTTPPSRPYGRYAVGLRPSLDPDAYFDAPSQDQEARRTNQNNTEIGLDRPRSFRNDRPRSFRNDLRASFTIKGITARLPLPVTITELGNRSVQISGQAEVDRAQFGLGWNRLGAIGTTATASADAVFVRAPK